MNFLDFQCCLGAAGTVKPNVQSAIYVAMQKHERENRSDILTLARGVVLGMLFAAIGVGVAFVILIAYFKAA